eukprot:14668387-Alexandrium_andersonii.AAC.1
MQHEPVIIRSAAPDFTVSPRSQCRWALCASAASVAVAPQLASQAYAPVDAATCTNAAPTSAGRAP